MSYRFLTAAEIASGSETGTIFNFEWPEFLKRGGTGATSALTKTLPFGHNFIKINKVSRKVWMASYTNIVCCEAAMLPALL